MPLATMRQMIEIGETEANLDEKEWSALLKFQIASENFESGYGHGIGAPNELFCKITVLQLFCSTVIFNILMGKLIQFYVLLG